MDYINKGLQENELCIYASVNAYDRSTLSKVSSNIIDYKENIGKGNLLIVDLRPFYNSALTGNLIHFEELKVQVQQELEHRSNKSIIIFADCADNLFQNQYFDQSELVESWWHRVYVEWIQQRHGNHGKSHITIICPHLDSILYKHPFNQHKYKIFDNHSVTLDIAGRIMTASSTPVHRIEEQQRLQPEEPTISLLKSQTHILIAEPEPDLQYIYNLWLRSKASKNIIITDSGRKCLEELIKIENITQRSNIIVILDSHLKDISFVEVAKEIASRKPDNQIIFTTTLPSDNVKLNSMGIDINKSKILLKPFRLAELLRAIDESVGNSIR